MKAPSKKLIILSLFFPILSSADAERNYRTCDHIIAGVSRFVDEFEKRVGSPCLVFQEEIKLNDDENDKSMTPGSMDLSKLPQLRIPRNASVTYNRAFCNLRLRQQEMNKHVSSQTQTGVQADLLAVQSCGILPENPASGARILWEQIISRQEHAPQTKQILRTILLERIPHFFGAGPKESTDDHPEEPAAVRAE